MIIDLKFTFFIIVLLTSQISVIILTNITISSPEQTSRCPAPVNSKCKCDNLGNLLITEDIGYGDLSLGLNSIWVLCNLLKDTDELIETLNTFCPLVNPGGEPSTDPVKLSLSIMITFSNLKDFRLQDITETLDCPLERLNVSFLVLFSSKIMHLDPLDLEPLSNTLLAIHNVDNPYEPMHVNSSLAFAKALRPLRRLQGIFFATHILTMLDFSHFTHFPNLTSLELEFPSVTVYQNSHKLNVGFENLETLAFASGLRAYPVEILHMPKLKTLTLSDPNMGMEAILNLTKLNASLEALTLEMADVVKLPQNFFEGEGLKHLRKLKLQNLKLEDLPKLCYALGDTKTGNNTVLNNMITLSLSQNRLTSSSLLKNNPFSDCTSLGELILDGNYIEFFPPTRSFNASRDTLTKLSVRSNKLTEFPGEFLQKFRNLTTLFLSYNKITDLPQNAFESNPKIYALDLSNNRIMSLPVATLAPLNKSLSKVILNENRLTKFNFKSLALFDNLSIVDLRKNKLTSLEDYVEIKMMRRNVRIFLRDNPLVCDCSVLEVLRAIDFDPNLTPYLHDDLRNVKCTHKLTNAQYSVLNISLAGILQSECGQNSFNTSSLLKASNVSGSPTFIGMTEKMSDNCWKSGPGLVSLILLILLLAIVFGFAVYKRHDLTRVTKLSRSLRISKQHPKPFLNPLGDLKNRKKESSLRVSTDNIGFVNDQP